MTDGFEFVPTNDYMIGELDKAHRQNARIVQSLPSTCMTHKLPTHATIGWLTMQSDIAIRKMVFLWSILCLPDTNIYKIITVFMIKLHDRNDVGSPESPKFSMYQGICKYKLRDFLMSCVRANHFHELNDMKLAIKREVWQHEKDCWKAIQILYPELRLFYSIVVDITVNIWWRIAAKSPCCTKWVSNMVCVIMGAEPRTRQCNFGRTMCKLCDMNRKDETLHVLSECPSLDDVRRHGWGDIKINMPGAMARHVETQLRTGWNLFYLDLVESTPMNGHWYTVLLPNLSQIYILKGIDCIQRATWTENFWHYRIMWRMMDLGKTVYI